MDRLNGIELRMNEIRAKVASFGASPTVAPFSRVFDNELTRATDLMSSSARATAVTASPLRPPDDLVAYGNGRLPDSALESIGQGGHRLAHDAARAFKAMAAAARRDGVVLSVSDSYRSLEDQQNMVDSHGHYDDGGLAAEPGTSAHGWGLAVDVDIDARTLRWMRAHASQYGFAEDVAREPWHWTFRQSRSLNGKA